jgi:hypothetical protein
MDVAFGKAACASRPRVAVRQSTTTRERQPIASPPTPRGRPPSLPQSGVESARPEVERDCRRALTSGPAPGLTSIPTGGRAKRRIVRRLPTAAAGAGLCMLQPGHRTSCRESARGRPGYAEPTSEDLDAVQEGGMQKPSEKPGRAHLVRGSEHIWQGRLRRPLPDECARPGFSYTV